MIKFTTRIVNDHYFFKKISMFAIFTYGYRQNKFLKLDQPLFKSINKPIGASEINSVTIN